MRRIHRGKQRKPEIISEDDNEILSSIKTNNDKTSYDSKLINYIERKRNNRSQVKRKTNEENHNNSIDENEEQLNDKSLAKNRKKDCDKIVNNKKESDEETEKDDKKKMKNKSDKCNIENYEEEKSIIDENKILLVKNKKSKVQRENKNEQDGEEYEVEKIVDQRTIKGRRQFLVRWKGYTVESDTWEQEKELNCDRLIEEFLTEQEENTEYFEKDIKQIKKKIKKQDKKIKILGKNNKIKNDTPKIHKNEDIEDSKEYEVERIIEVHFKKNKTREFLIRWKGFSPNEDTWEPEKHLNCPELINKFMEKLEKIKSVEARELRANPSHTKHFLLNVHGGKRQSRRNSNKQRVTYYEYD